MSEQERKNRIKKTVEEESGISHTELIGAVKDCMAKSTAEKIIKQMLASQEIISRKDGKKKRYHLVEPKQKRLEKDFSGNVKKLRKKLDAVERDFASYHYEIQIQVNKKILDSVDQFGSEIKQRLKTHQSFYSVDNSVRDYESVCMKISKLLGIGVRSDLGTHVRSDLRHMIIRYINDTNSGGLLYHVVSKASTLRNQRDSLKSGAKRNKLSERIKHLDMMESTLFRHIDEILFKLTELEKVKKQDELPLVYGEPPLSRTIQHVEERRHDFQKMIQKLHESVVQNSGKSGGVQAGRSQDAGLVGAATRLESIRTALDDVGKILDEQHRNTFADKIEQELYDVIKKAEDDNKNLKTILKGMNR